MSNIGIIGGGASGLIAAIFSARKGHNVTIVERLDRVGKKILATGNGRCNLTNQNIAVSRYHGRNIDQLSTALSVFSLEDTLRFFHSIGVDTIADSSGKVYPRSLQATSVLDNLRYECIRLSVKENCGFEVKTVQKRKNDFLLTSYDGQTILFDRLILAAGGKASKQLGSNGTGHQLASDLGHNITPLFAALTKVQVEENYLKSIAGVKIMGVATVNHSKSSEQDEILFTENGLSGPAIFDISRCISERTSQHIPVEISLDLFPNMSATDLQSLLYERKQNMPYKTMGEIMIGFLPKKLIFPILATAGINKRTLSADSTVVDWQRLSAVLKDWTFHAEKVAPFAEAQVCCGGVPLDEIKLSTMESKKCPGVYLAGELLDVDGDCGGFNLQWAWTSGAIAGQNI